MDKIGTGRTAEAYDAGDGKILKLFYSHISDSHVEREYSTNYLLAQKIDSMPKVYDKVTKDGRQGIVFQKITSIHMGSYMMQNPNRIPEVIRKFSQLHCEINSAVIDTNTLSIDTADTLIHRIQESSILSRAEKKIVSEYLTATDSKNLCHGDFHPENVLIDSNSNLWVIDWMTSVICSSMFDIARTYYLLRYGKSPEKKPLNVALVERLVCLYLSNTYYKIRIKNRSDTIKFDCYFFIILVLRLNDRIPEERSSLLKLIKRSRKKALHTMSVFLKPKTD